jgi:carbamate kinase
MLLEHQTTVICGGGGGIPVVRTAPDASRYEGIGCVIDKDRTASLMATELKCDALVILTDVPHVLDESKTPILTIQCSDIAEDWIAQFPAGSMRPKVESCLDFVRKRPEGFAAIGSIAHLDEILKGKSGTRFIQ